MGATQGQEHGILVKPGSITGKRDNKMLEIENICVNYGRHSALDDVSLKVHPGEIVALIGPNGAGKTTLIRAVSGVQSMKSGIVRILGQDLLTIPVRERARLLAVVPQARNLPPAFTVYESTLMGRTPYLGWLGQAGTADRERALHALESTQLQELSSRRVGELSGGEQQRVLLARALAQETPVLLLDEPTTHLDLQHQSRLLNLVRSLASERQLSVLMALHDLNLAGLYADRVALLVNGHLQACGTPHEVLTEKTLAEVYRIPVHVVTHPEYGSPLILPDGHERS
jgi:iron complex transport system ATP-binding protein